MPYFETKAARADLVGVRLSVPFALSGSIADASRFVCCWSRDLLKKGVLTKLVDKTCTSKQIPQRQCQYENVKDVQQSAELVNDARELHVEQIYAISICN